MQIGRIKTTLYVTSQLENMRTIPIHIHITKHNFLSIYQFLKRPKTIMYKKKILSILTRGPET